MTRSRLVEQFAESTLISMIADRHHQSLLLPVVFLTFSLVCFPDLSFAQAGVNETEQSAIISDITYDAYSNILTQAPATLSPAAQDLLRKAQFDVVAIHLLKDTDYRQSTTTFSFDDKGNFKGSGVSLQFLISMAWGIRNSRILGGPDWFVTNRYTLDARSDEELGKQISGYDGPTQKLIRQHMLQAMLEDRFQLKAHMATKPLRVLLLEESKRGSKLQESKKDAVGSSQRTANYQTGVNTSSKSRILQGDEMGIDQLAAQLSLNTGQVVLNHTNLKGKYGIKLEWSDESTHEAAETIDNPNVLQEKPLLPVALEEQLGLRLVSGRVPIEVLVIDHIEMPSEN